MRYLVCSWDNTQDDVRPWEIESRVLMVARTVDSNACYSEDDSQDIVHHVGNELELEVEEVSESMDLGSGTVACHAAEEAAAANTCCILGDQVLVEMDEECYNDDEKIPSLLVMMACHYYLLENQAWEEEGQ